MKIHLRQIPPGGTLHLEGEEDAEFLDPAECGAEPAAPLRYSLDAGLSEGGLFATGRLEVRVRLKCVACLEPFETDLIIEDFALQKELDGRELVDLIPEIREDIYLVLPPHPRCDADGRRKCSASFPQAPASRPPAGPSGWDALDKLKTDN